MYIYKNIITLEAGKRGGKPCIRGMRITVEDILRWLASGIRTGNCSTAMLSAILADKVDSIKAFILNEDFDIYEVLKP